MRSELIVCTRNRPAEMQRLLENLPGQSVRPRLVVVDSSEGAETERLVDRFAEDGEWSLVTYVRSEPGLTRQRMRGVAEVATDAEVVHFLDDDVLLEPGYFEAVENVFALDSAVVGASGLVTNSPPHRPRVLNRLFLLDSTREGTVLASGVNIRVFSAQGVCPVEWLSGCCMSYRRRVFDSLSFDVALAGYALGEDADFSYSAASLGSLVVVGDARLQHLEQGAGSADHRAHVRDDIVRRYRFVSRFADRGMSRPAFWWSVFGDIVVTLGKIALLGDRAMRLQKLRGIFDAVGMLQSQRGVRA